MPYQIVSDKGLVRSTHKTRELAEKRMRKNLAWRCGICGSTKGGWGTCSHGAQNRVCCAEHYNDRIIFRP